MKYLALFTALGLASATFLAVGAPEGRDARGLERLKQADTDGNGMISRTEATALPMIAKRRAEHWKKVDTNGDGKISKAEAQANAPRLYEHFDQLDANKDGFLTPDELKAARGEHRAKK
jgi:Ca2+-binding EF-hand superfamily protein